MVNGWKQNCWTCFDTSDKVIAAVESVVADGHASYCVYQHEICPTTHKHHLQGFTIFKKKMSFKALRLLFGVEDGKSLHVEKLRGTIVEASDYCKKDDSRKPGTVYYESGPCPVKSGDQGKRNDLLSACEDINNGMAMKDVALLHPSTFVRLHKGLATYKSVTSTPRVGHTVSLIIYGASDAGKTHWVRNAYPNAIWMSKGANSLWWDEYDDHAVVVFDEFNGGVLSLSTFKRLIDKSPLSLCAKGSVRNIKPALVIFLSNDAPSEWYSKDLMHGEHEKAFNRRLHVIIRVDQLIGLHGAKLPRYRAKCEKMFLPYDMNIGTSFRFDSLSCDQSAEFFNSGTTEARRETLTSFLTRGQESKARSGGVIMTPPTYLTWESNVSSQLEGLTCYAFGCKEYAAGVTPPLNDDMSAPTLTMVPVSRRQVDNPTSHNAPIHPFQTLPAALNTRVDYVPATSPSAAAASIDESAVGLRILASASTKRPTPFTLKRTKRARRCPYIDDEAECSDSDSEATHSSSSSSDVASHTSAVDRYM